MQVIVLVPVIMVLDRTMQRVQKLDKHEDEASYERKCVFDEDLLSARNPCNLCFCWSQIVQHCSNKSLHSLQGPIYSADIMSVFGVLDSAATKYWIKHLTFSKNVNPALSFTFKLVLSTKSYL